MDDETASPFQRRAQQPLLHRTFPVTRQVPGAQSAGPAAAPSGGGGASSK